MDTTLRILILLTHAHGGAAPVTRKPDRLPRAILACTLFSLALGQAEGRPRETSIGASTSLRLMCA